MSVIENTVVLDSSPEEVFAMLTEPDRLRRWMTISARIDLRAGGEYRFVMAPGHVAEGQVVEVVPGKLISYTWNWNNSGTDFIQQAGTVSIEIEPVAAGTQVTLRHDGLGEEAIESHTGGWQHFMERLVLADRHGDAGWDDWSTGPEDGMDSVLVAEASLAVILPLMRQFTLDDREKQTPCAEYNLHDLFEHLLGSLVFLGKANGAEMEELLGDDAHPESRIAEAAMLAIESYSTCDLSGTIVLGGNEVPALVGVNIIGLELLVHAWDFARTIAAEITVAEHITNYCNPIFEALIGGSEREPNERFAASTVVNVDANGIDRLAAMTGRAV